MAAPVRTEGRNRRGSLIVSLVLALAAVAALPLALMAYQVSLSREAMVEQAQRTHLIAARATADRVEAALSALVAATEGAAQNPQLFDAPDSVAAGEVLKGLLVGETRLRAAALFHSGSGREVLVQMARAPAAAALPAQSLAGLGPRVLLHREGDDLFWGLSRDTGRPGLRLAVLADAAAIDELLQPRELGPSARLLLLQDTSPHPALPVDTALPESLLQALGQRELDALAVRAEGDSGVEVSAFARVAGTDWSIASLQPAEEAEAAAARMRQGALVASAVVLVLIVLLSLFAWRRVVRPVRALLDWQRSAMSAEAGGGSDLSNLREAFAQIQRNQRNREALGEVFVGRYRLLSTLGQGAMGSVFLAWDPKLKRHVAIKTLHLEALDARQQLNLAQALEAEAIKIAKLQHPNIVGVYDLVAAGEFVFVVMEYVEGGNLRGLIDHHGVLEPAEVVLIARAVLGALHVAHRGGLLHLDIKPSNLLVSPEGEVKLADFGVSAWRSELPELLTREGAAGTPGFIAPEYVSGAQPSERSDLFSLGVVLVECMTGVRQNLPGARSADLLRAARLRRAPPAGSRQDTVALWMAVQALCHADPELRPASASAALEMFAQMDTAGAAVHLAERVAAIGARGAVLPSDASTRARDLATTQPLPVVPSAADERLRATTLQPWAEATRPQPWAEPTQAQPWAEPTQAQPWAEPTEPQPWAQDTRVQPWGEEHAPASAHGVGVGDTPEDTTRTARYRPSAGPDGSTAALPRGDLSALDATTRPAQRRPELPDKVPPGRDVKGPI
jgi:serine/threonine protein kinase